MTASLRGLAIEGQAGSPFINIGNIRASLSPTSLYKRALVLSQVAVTSPSISIVRNGPGQYSFTDILMHKQGAKNKINGFISLLYQSHQHNRRFPGF